MAYSPLPAPSDPSQSAAWAVGEMQRVAQSQSDTQDGIAFNPLAVAPKRARKGMAAYADGTNWNPGNGAGLYLYDGTGWKKVGPPLTGTAVLVGGTKVVTLASVTAASLIFLTSNINGGTPGFLRVSARSVGVSFTILSSSATDTSTVAYLVIEP